MSVYVVGVALHRPAANAPHRRLEETACAESRRTPAWRQRLSVDSLATP